MKKIKKWKLLAEEDVSPSPWFPVYKHKVQLPDGKVVDDYYVSRLEDVAMIVAVTKEKEIAFVKQYKHGIRRVMLELPAGRVKKGDTPLKTAKRELAEETGIAVKSIVSLGEIVPVPSKEDTLVHGFLVKDVEINSKQSLDETENIQVEFYSFKKTLRYIRSGKINGTDTIAILTLAQLKHPNLFK